MANYTAQQGAALQYQLSVQLKAQLMNMSLESAREVQQLLWTLRPEDNKVFTRVIREVFPQLVLGFGMQSAQVLSGFYLSARELHAETEGAGKEIRKDFTPDPTVLTKSPEKFNLIQVALGGSIAYNFNKLWAPESVYKNMVEGDVSPITSRLQLEKPLAAIVERRVLDFSYSTMEEIQATDDAAKDKPRRVTRGAGSCTFCKHMATYVGDTISRNKFHDTCKCTPGPAWAYENTYAPDWARDYEDQYNNAKDKLNEEANHFTKERYRTTRYSKSQGKEVETIRTRYIDDRTGQPGKPPSTSTENILKEIDKMASN